MLRVRGERVERGEKEERKEREEREGGTRFVSKIEQAVSSTTKVEVKYLNMPIHTVGALYICQQLSQTVNRNKEATVTT